MCVYVFSSKDKTLDFQQVSTLWLLLFFFFFFEWGKECLEVEEWRLRLKVQAAGWGHADRVLQDT